VLKQKKKQDSKKLEGQGNEGIKKFRGILKRNKRGERKWEGGVTVSATG